MYLCVRVCVCVCVLGMPDSMAGWARGLVLDSTLHTPALNVGTSAMDNKATGMHTQKHMQLASTNTMK